MIDSWMERQMCCIRRIKENMECEKVNSKVTTMYVEITMSKADKCKQKCSLCRRNLEIFILFKKVRSILSMYDGCIQTTIF